MVARRSTIVVADDDPNDRLLIGEALGEVGFAGEIRFAEDGVELLDCLQNDCSWPAIILLDLNMPRMDGREVLKELRLNPSWRSIPVVVYSTSDLEEDISFCYRHGANSYVSKPGSYEKLKEHMKELVRYWFELAALPSGADSFDRDLLR